METTDLEQLAAIRAAVGYLGEKDQAGWWPSSFFATGSSAFLAPLFPRTQFLAQCQGVTAAAAKVHDERIGVGQVYHLFRLPEDMEQAIHRILHNENAVDRIRQLLTDIDQAREFLRQGTEQTANGDVGPVRIADLTKLRTPEPWQIVAAKYAVGFETKTEIFPYFANGK